MLMMRPLFARSWGEEGVRHVEHAVEIDRRDVLPVLEHGICIRNKRVAPVDAGIVDEDRNRTDFFADLRGDRAAGRVIGHVERKILRLAARVADFGGRARRCLAVDVERCDLRSLAANPNAIARPIPEPAPVTAAMWFCRSAVILVLRPLIGPEYSD